MTGQPTSDLDIAVIGMACRFPGATSVESFWRNLRDGVESITFFTEEELRRDGVSAEALANPAYVRASAVLDDVERFDARFFGYTPREAQVLDPQQRLFLEACWEALERAGYDPERHRGPIGVFGGGSGTSWLLVAMSNPALLGVVSPYQVMLGSDAHLLAPRVAYKLNLHGPAVVVQTACSTSLVAAHMACQSLLAGECDMALAGGVSISVPQRAGYVHETDGILSSDGHCRTFDAEADGTVKGSGVGLIVLKRLADALRDRDQIEAVIKGSAVNNDGARKVGFTAPGVEGQARVIRTALATAGLRPEDVTYVEAHGTATALGDPIEIAALTHAFRTATPKRGYCAIGSVKTNIGHLDAAAGVAGLIKAILMLKHRELVPSLHFERPNPRIDFAESPFFVSTRRAPWTTDGRPRRAGVSSFGIGGTNAHVVLEEAPAPQREPQSPRTEILVLSARSEAALDQATDALAAHLDAHPEESLEDVAFTLRAGRRPFSFRRAVVCGDAAEAARTLTGRDPRQVWSALAEEGRPVAFLIAGQGAQHVNLAAGVYGAEAGFRDEVDACSDILRPLVGLDVRRLLFPSAAEAAEATERLKDTRVTQPALFAVEYALARLWMSWGVVPEAMLGHSLGEYVAACLAGVFTRDQALVLVAERARLMQECPPGAMTNVALSTEAARALLDGRLDLCVMNGPDNCVVGGRLEDVERLEARLQADGVAFSRLPTSHAFHSALMEPALAPFARLMAAVPLKAPTIPFVSSVTATWVTAEQATDPGHWVRQLREPVRFSEALETLVEKPQRVFLEVGPAHTLVSLAKRRFSPGSGALLLASLPHPRQNEPDATFFLHTAAQMWTAGVPIDWSPRDKGRAPRRVLLPTYPFERERHWIEPGRSAAGLRPAPAGRLAAERWLYAPSWRRTETVAPSLEPETSAWCVFADETGIGEALAVRLREGGATVTVVRPGPDFAWGEGDACVLEPTRRADYERLFDELAARGDEPTRVVHLWGVGGDGADSDDLGLLSVLRVGEVLGRRANEETTLTVVSSGTQDVLGTEPLRPRRAAVLGPCRVLAQEFPLLACRSVDVLVPGDAAADLVEPLLGEITSDAIEPAVAYRGRYRWIQAFDPIAPPVAEGPRLRPRGVYLLTGGLGNVGLALAAHLARTVQARLVLTGRSGLPDRPEWEARLAAADRTDVVAARIRAVRELEALGAEVMVLRADAADGDQMRAAVARTREAFGRLDGVVHAAGDVGRDALRPVTETQGGDFERQLRPKLGGAEVIDALLDGEEIDFVFLTSSLSAVLGGLGYAAYSAVNCALDAFAHRQHQRGKRFWMSAGWDAWRFQSDPGEGDRLAHLAIGALEGGETFGRLLALSPRPQVVVSTTPLQERLEQWTMPARAEEAGDDAGQPLERGPRPQMSAVYVAPDDPIERRLAALWAEMLGIDRVGVDDNFFELGGSSMLAVHLMGRLKKEYPVELSVATLFEASTVRTLSRVIRSRQGPDPGLARSADRGQARKGIRNRQRRTSDAAVE